MLLVFSRVLVARSALIMVYSQVLKALVHQHSSITHIVQHAENAEVATARRAPFRATQVWALRRSTYVGADHSLKVPTAPTAMHGENMIGG